jgi:hypothetical protein
VGFGAEILSLLDDGKIIEQIDVPKLLQREALRRTREWPALMSRAASKEKNND